MLDFQKSSFQLSVKESSSIRITVGGRDALEAAAPGALPLEEQPGGGRKLSWWVSGEGLLLA